MLVRRVNLMSSLRNAHGLATALNAIIESGGWKVKEGAAQAVFSKPVDGVVIVVASRPPPDAANELFRALKMGGIIATGRLVRGQKPGRVSLWIGSRPGGDSLRGHRVWAKRADE